MQGSSGVDRELLDAAALVGHLVPMGSVFAFLAGHRREVFPDEMFADLFGSGTGRPSLPADAAASVLVLQALHDTSDRETAEAVRCDIRWKVACGLAVDDAGFHLSTLTYWRRRLAQSERPDRVFEVEDVFLAWPAASADSAPEAVESIAKHARRIVFLSSMAVQDEPDDTEPIFHAHIERAIERSGVTWTFVRPGGFATNALGWAPQIREGVVRWPYGAAARSLIHERDIAAVAVRALTEDGHAGAKYLLTGPEAVTQAEQVRIIGDVIGRPVRWEDIPAEEARRQLLADGWPPTFADGALDYWATLEVNPEPVTTTMEQITGVPARTFRDWVIDHADDFRPLTTTQVADEYVALCRQGKFGDPVMGRLFSADVVRTEPVDGTPVEMRGDEITENMNRFVDDSEIHGVDIDGPFVGWDRFAVRFAIDQTIKATGVRSTITKISLYSVADGKIMCEEVYYNAPPPPSEV